MSDAARLRARASYFFGSTARNRGEVAAIVSELAGMGQVVVIGGMLRDLTLSGNRAFRSDVDLVAHPASLGAFERLTRRYGGIPNRFGGHAIALGHWRVDVWPLERTWAAVNGHVAVETPEDLLATTFFDWDAILYDPVRRRLHHRPGYFDRLSRREIEVNLVPNPNPLGNAVRALRYAIRWKARMGPGLVAHVGRQVHGHGWDALVATEARAFGDPMLGGIPPSQVARLARVGLTAAAA